jgi:hypothetical protein
MDVPGCPIFLKNKKFAQACISVDKPKWVVEMVVRPIASLSEELDQLCLATVLSGRRRAAISCKHRSRRFHVSTLCRTRADRFGVATQIRSGVWQVRPRSFAATFAGQPDGSTAGTSDSATVSLSSRLSRPLNDRGEHRGEINEATLGYSRDAFGRIFAAPKGTAQN